MSDTEKEEHPEYKTTGGYLKVKKYKQAWKEAWDNATEEDRLKTFELPNFDPQVFFEVTGIDVREWIIPREDVENYKKK